MLPARAKMIFEKKGIGLALLAVSVLIMTMFAGCVEEGKTVTVKGSSTVLPIASACAEEFMKQHPDVTVSVAGGGSSVGIKAVGTGEADIGDASREIKDSEIAEYPNVDFVDHVIAKDGVAVIVSKEINQSGVTGITMSELRGIYNGTITNWNEIGGPDREIFVVERDEGSGTRDTFMDAAGLDETAADVAKAANSNVKQAVSGSNAGIGYVGLGYVSDDTPALKIDGVYPSEGTIKSNDYPITRSLHMYTNGDPTGAVKQFLDFIMGAEGQAIVEEQDFITIT